MVTNVLLKRESKAKSIASELYAMRLDIALILIVLIFSFYVRYASLMDIGITWDEPAYIHAGIVYIDNLSHFNFTSDAYSYNMEHPPVSKYLYGIAIWAFNGGKEDYNAYVVAKTMSAVLGAATCALLYLTGRKLFSERVAFVSAIILSLIPVFLAHTQIAAIDGPVAFFFTLTMYLFIVALKTKSKRYFTASAITLGLLVDTKFTGFLALPVMALFFISLRYSVPHDKKVKISDRLRYYLPLKHVLGFLLIATATAIIIYPWIWGGLDHIMLTWNHWTDVAPEYFLGTMEQAPLGYYPVYFLATNPALLFIPLALGIFFVLRSKDPYKLAVLIWFVVPFAYDLGSFKQNGTRYILMIYPAMALLCAEGISGVADKIGQIAMNGRWLKDAIFLAMGALTILYLISVLIPISPYYLDYYNEVSGGLPNVYENKLFVVDWWGEGLYDSVMYIEHTAPSNSTVAVIANPSHVIQPYGHNMSYIPIGSQKKYMQLNTDYILTNTHSDWYKKAIYDPSKYRLVYVTQVQGVPLARVFKKVA